MTTAEGFTALYLAAEAGHVGVAEALIDAGANPEIACSGLRADAIAANRGHVDISYFLKGQIEIVDYHDMPTDI